MSRFYSTLTRSQRRKYLVAGVVIPLACSYLIGGALAVLTHWQHLRLAGAAFAGTYLYTSIIYFMEPAS